MSADILILPTKCAVEAAWDRYTVLAAQLAKYPHLFWDEPEFREDLANAKQEWLDVYDLWCRRAA